MVQPVAGDCGMSLVSGAPLRLHAAENQLGLADQVAPAWASVNVVPRCTSTAPMKAVSRFTAARAKLCSKACLATFSFATRRCAIGGGSSRLAVVVRKPSTAATRSRVTSTVAVPVAANAVAGPATTKRVWGPQVRGRNFTRFT